MLIRLELAKDRFGARESMPGTVTIVNDGDRVLEVPDPESNSNWQPTYTIRGPAFPDGFTFSMRSAVFRDPTPNPPGVEPLTVQLEPGQAHSVCIPLDNLIALTKPGAYTMTANLDWGGRSVQSDPITFRIERPMIRSCRLIARPGLQDTYAIQVFALQGEGPAAEIQIASYARDPQTDRIVLQSLNRFAAAGAEAEVIVAPWLNYAGIGTPPPRAAWQAGDTLSVAGYGEDQAQALSLPWTPRVVRPALTPRSAELDLFVLGHDGRTLGLVRFPATGGDDDIHLLRRSLSGGEDNSPPPPAADEEKLPRLLWQHELDLPAVAARAALSPEERGDTRHVLLVTATDEAAELSLVEMGPGEKTPTLRTVRVDRWQPLTPSEPALRVDAQGNAHGSVLLASEPKADGTRSIAVADVQWPITEGDAQLTVREVAVAAPVASAVSYSLTKSESPRRDWVLLTSDGGALSSCSPDRIRPLQGRPMTPPDLLAIDEFTYVLTVSEAGTLEFERLD